MAAPETQMYWDSPGVVRFGVTRRLTYNGISLTKVYPLSITFSNWTTQPLFDTSVVLQDENNLVGHAVYPTTGFTVDDNSHLITVRVAIPAGVQSQFDHLTLVGMDPSGVPVWMRSPILPFATPPTTATGLWLELLWGTRFKLHWDPPPPAVIGGISKPQFIDGARLGAPDVFGDITNIAVASNDISANSLEFDMFTAESFTTDASLFVTLFNTNWGTGTWAPLPRTPPAATGITVTPLPFYKALVSWVTPVVDHVSEIVVMQGSDQQVTYDLSSTSVKVDLDALATNLNGVGPVGFTLSLRNHGLGAPTQASFTMLEYILWLNQQNFSEVVYAGTTIKLEAENASYGSDVTAVVTVSGGGAAQTIPITFAEHFKIISAEVRRAGTVRISATATDASGTPNMVFPSEYAVQPLPVALSASLSQCIVAAPITITVAIPMTDVSHLDNRTTYSGVFTMTSSGAAGAWDVSSFTVPTTRPWTTTRTFTPSALGPVTFGITNADLDLAVTPASVVVRDPGLIVWVDAPTAQCGAPVVVKSVYTLPYPGGIGGTIDFTATQPGRWGDVSGDFSAPRSVVTRTFTPSFRGVVGFDAIGHARGVHHPAASVGPTWSSTLLVAGTVAGFAAAVATSPAFLAISVPAPLVASQWNAVTVTTDVSWSGRIALAMDVLVGSWLDGKAYVDVVAGATSVPAQWRLTDLAPPPGTTTNLNAYLGDASWSQAVLVL